MIHVTIAALLLSFAVYLFIGIRLGFSTKSIGDLLPISRDKQASVRSAREFSSSTVATTISLATVVVAFFELAPYFGVWLFWCVLTTAGGIWAVRLLAPQIWKRLAPFEKRPSLHEFLGHSFGSNKVALVGAICTVLGFLSAFALELTVGARFISGLIKGYPQWTIVATLSVVAFVYTSLGGFRAVVVTDRIQMVAIWLLLFSLSAFTFYYIDGHGGWDVRIGSAPDGVFELTYREGLISFMVGIFIINIFAYAADMSVWQRIAASDKPQTIASGLGKSVLQSALTWTVLVGLACLALTIIQPVEGENPLLTLLATVGLKSGAFGQLVLFFVVLGLFGAMLSTASTQLIAVSHTLYEDIASRFRKKIALAERLSSGKELFFSRVLLIYAALVAVIAVEWLTYFGFSVADLVFAVYGAQLSLLPPILLALFANQAKLKHLAGPAAWAIGFGFCAGWSGEFVGRLLNSPIASLSPIISIAVSGCIMGFSYFVSAKSPSSP